MASRRKEAPAAGSPATLLTWHSIGHGVKVLRNAVELLRERGVPIQRVLYLCQAVAQGEQARGCAAELAIELTPVVVALVDKEVTCHSVILGILEKKVCPLVERETALHINISPGTPAMHAVWLLMHARGAFPARTKLWSSQVDREDQRHLDAVDFSINTYLQAIRETQEAQPDLGHFDLDPRSARRRRAHEQLLRYGRVRKAPLLVIGERGSGKTRLLEDRLAKIKDRRRVVTVPCGTLRPELAMSQLFGHRKGAFTGADEARGGYLQDAEGEVLLLDEVQDLPKEVQRQLVRLLQDRHRRYRRLGETEERSADVEVVCASHLSLTELRGKLDADLFDRLSLLLIEWPPLRECREDLPSDFRQVWRELRSDVNFVVDPPDDEALWAALQEAELPGNMRDLQRLAYLLMARYGQPRWVPEALAEWQQVQGRLQDAEQGRGLPRSAEDLTTRTWTEHVHQFKRELAQDAYGEFGSYEEAARALHTTGKTLSDAVKRYPQASRKSQED